MNIEWNRVAKPQPDQYDSYVISNFLNKKYGWEKKLPSAGASTICDEKIAVVPFHLFPLDSLTLMGVADGCAKWNSEHAQKLQPFLQTWNDGHEMLKCLLDEYWPLWSPTMSKYGMGGVSGHRTVENFINMDFFTAVYSTINNLQGCAQGIYHEVGHIRLESIGIHFEDHDGALLLNKPTELYNSPIRRDKKRPMTAVIQAVYSWLMFCENDLQCAKISQNSNISAQYLIANLPKIEDGLKEIQDNVKTTPAGRAFMDGYFEWGHDIIIRTKDLCRFEMANFDSEYVRARQYREVQYSHSDIISSRIDV